MGQLNHHFLSKIENQTHAFYFDNFTVNLIYREVWAYLNRGPHRSWFHSAPNIDSCNTTQEIKRSSQAIENFKNNSGTLWHEGNRKEPIKLRHKTQSKTKVVHLELFVNKTLSQEVIKWS